MRVEFSRTGGFAGPAAVKRTVVDSSSLTSAEAQELDRLVESASNAKPVSEDATNKQSRDSFTYQIRVERDKGPLVLDGRKSELSVETHALIEWLEKRASVRSVT